MDEEYGSNGARFIMYDKSKDTASLVYRPPWAEKMQAKNATIGVKFAQSRIILDNWYLFGGTKWNRFKFRMKHPKIYSKRALRKLWRRFKRIFVKPKMIQPLAKHPYSKIKGKS